MFSLRIEFVLKSPRGRRLGSWACWCAAARLGRWRFSHLQASGILLYVLILLVTLADEEIAPVWV